MSTNDTLRGLLAEASKCLRAISAYHGMQNMLADRIDSALAEPVSGDEFCHYCGGNDEEPQDHCMDCARPSDSINQQIENKP